MIISSRILLRMKHILDDTCRENQNPNFILNTFFSKIVTFMPLHCQSYCISDYTESHLIFIKISVYRHSAWWADCWPIYPYNVTSSPKNPNGREEERGKL
jgi:hypothetical protein